MQITISAERPDSADAIRLIGELEDELEPFYPRTSRHGYSVEQLIAQGVAFFVVRADNALAGCGGIQLFAEGYGELKRMYVRRELRGRRIAEALLAHLSGYAAEHGVTRVRLETGIHQQAAIRLYERWGFQRCGPFGNYHLDPLSIFMEKSIL